MRVIILLKQSDPSLKYEVFNRLNTGGDNLLPQEVRNAMFEGKFNDLLIELSENEMLVKYLVSSLETYPKSTVYKEMQDVEYVLRFFTVKHFWQDFPCNNMQIAMNLYMRNISESMSDLELEKKKKLFNKSLEICNLIWEDKTFQRPDGSKKIIQGIYDSQMVSVAKYIEEGRADDLIQHKAQIFSKFTNTYTADQIYQNSMRQFTSNANNVKKRIEKTIELIGSIINE